MKRRTFLSNAGTAAGALLVPSYLTGNSGLMRYSKDKFSGLRLGAITYSFRSMPSTADDLLGYLVKLGLGVVELMGEPIEEYAGAPKGPAWKRGELTDAEKAERATYATEIKKFRTTATMDKFKALRKKYNDQGVEIGVVKFGMDRMSPEEIDYCFNVARTMGANGITLERTDDTMKMLGPYADKNKIMVGYHNHTEVNFNSWDAGLAAHKYNAMNLDVGHYVAGTNESPIPLIKKYSDRILNLHLKDRKKNNGDNMPWGQGDTPLREILQLMKKEKYTFMADIELEYPIPEGSNAVTEVGKCIDFCKEALA
jgi:sugar phosphate isomerase/epimerase